MPTAFLSPFTNDTNDYINRMKSVLTDCGYEVVPFSFRTLLSCKARGLLSRQNVILVHWMESRVFSEGRSGSRIRPAGLIQFLIYAMVLACARAPLIYFVHDHAVHDLLGWRRSLSRGLIGLLRRLAAVRVVHDPSFCDAYQATYLPHPLYQERDTQVTVPRASTEAFRAGILGAIRPYKRIEYIVDVWPADTHLLIRGRCDPAYEALLRERIEAKGPGHQIVLSTGFMSREAFDAELSSLDMLLLPHADASALVSGAFFEAIGKTPIILARTTPFIEWASQQFSGVIPYQDETAIPGQISTALQSLQSSRASSATNLGKVTSLFGHSHCVQVYKQALQAAQ
jgi:glycosyltransferase involved in cell wall biosynthesis